MPKYISRNQFEQMKVLKKRGSSNAAVAKALGMSPATVSKNLKYNSYEDYLVSMYGRNSKSQKEVEAKSGPVRIVTPDKKTCKKCGKTKPIDEFYVARMNRDGHEGACKECRYKNQRGRKKARKVATTAEVPHVETAKDDPRKERSPDLVTWEFIAEELKKMHAPEKDEEAYGHIAVCPTSCPRPALPWLDEPEDKNDDDKDEDGGIKVNECVYVDINNKVKRGVVIAINNASYNPDYIVRLDTWFFRKEVKVNQYHIFRRDEA